MIYTIYRGITIAVYNSIYKSVAKKNYFLQLALTWDGEDVKHTSNWTILCLKYSVLLWLLHGKVPVKEKTEEISYIVSGPQMEMVKIGSWGTFSQIYAVDCKRVKMHST